MPKVRLPKLSKRQRNRKLRQQYESLVASIEDRDITSEISFSESEIQVESRSFSNLGEEQLIAGSSFGNQTDVQIVYAPCCTQTEESDNDLESVLLCSFSDADNSVTSAQDMENPSFNFHVLGEEVPDNHLLQSLLFDDSSFENRLATWALECNVAHSSVNKLLELLKSHSCFNSFPKDARTLLKTPRNSNVKIMSPGQYIYFGLEDGLLYSLHHYNGPTPPSLELLFNIDGLPLAKSSGSQFWPILGAFYNIRHCKPFVIAVYHGYKKPDSCSVFLADFVKEAKHVLLNGVFFNNKHIQVKLKGFICDSPARCFIKCVKGHAGYFGCEKCTQEGNYKKGRMTFPEINAPLRTDVSFSMRLQEEHHIDNSVLEQLGIEMVTQFPYEYMHLVCLGVIRKVVNLWLSGPSLKYRLPGASVTSISDFLTSIGKLVCHEFARKPRSLTEVKRWKATEWRQFLLYTGPVVLNEVLSKKYFVHFLALHAAIRILAARSLCYELNSYAKDLLFYFVRNFGKLYGEEQLSFNVHGLIHLSNDVLNYGPLDKFSAFQFESFLHELKCYLRTQDKPLQQLIKRTEEERRNFSSFNSRGSILRDYPVLDAQSRKLYFETFFLSTSPADNCCIMKDTSIVLVEKFVVKDLSVYIVGKKFLCVEDIYTMPCASSIVETWKVSKTSQSEEWSVNDVYNKALKIPFNLPGESFAVFSLIHNL